MGTPHPTGILEKNILDGLRPSLYKISQILGDTKRIITSENTSFNSLTKALNSHQDTFIIDLRFQITMIMTNYTLNKWNHLLNVLRMFYSIIIIFIAYLFFTSGSKKFIMEPVELLTKFLNRLINNPLDVNINKMYTNFIYARRSYIEETFIHNDNSKMKQNNKAKKLKSNKIFAKEEVKRSIQQNSGFLNGLGLTPNFDIEDQFELIVILLGLMRLFLWMSCAFGSQMAPLIIQKMVLNEEEMTSKHFTGRKMQAYMAIIQLKDFFDVIDYKKEKSFYYVQELADLMYRTSDRYHATAEIIRDGKFIILWKLDNPEAKDNFNAKKINRNSSEIASVSVTTILKILSKLWKLRREHKIEPNTNSIYVSSKLNLIFQRKKKDFYEFIQIALHAGKFYESITGSYLKGDISYMGLDITHTHSLHNLTNEYNTAFILSSRVSFKLFLFHYNEKE